MRRLKYALIASIAFGGTAVAWGQSDVRSPASAAPFGQPVDDQRVYVHALLEQFEYRAASTDSVSRWEGEGWIGTDTNRMWVKSEGEVNRHGDVTAGEQELLYDRPVSSFFDVQAGLRYDLDSSPGRAWAAIGFEGLAPYFFHVAVTAYASDGGHFAGKAQGYHDFLLTQRLILQPQVEVNVYSKDDPQRRLGSGISDADAGVRLRYEISRKLAPYFGVCYQRAFAQTAQYERLNGARAENFSVSVGIRSWF